MTELNIEAKTEHLEQVLMFVNEELEKADCSAKTQMQVDLAVEEVFVNIASYAYQPQTGMAAIRAEYEREASVFTLTFLDRGRPFDPLAKPDPDVKLSAEERDTGGLGIYLAKKLMDRIEYRYENGSNILTIQKKI